MNNPHRVNITASASACAKTSTSASTRTMGHKFIPAYEYHAEHNKNSSNTDTGTDACNVHQSFVVACLEKALSGGGDCNHAFSEWNACLAKDCGFTTTSSTMSTPRTPDIGAGAGAGAGMGARV